LHLDRAEAAVALDVGRAGLRLDARALGAGDRDGPLGVAEAPPAAVADVDHDLVALASVSQLDPCVLHGRLAGVVVAQRLEHDRRLPHLPAPAADLAHPPAARSRVPSPAPRRMSRRVSPGVWKLSVLIAGASRGGAAEAADGCRRGL